MDKDALERVVQHLAVVYANNTEGPDNGETVQRHARAAIHRGIRGADLEAAFMLPASKGHHAWQIIQNLERAKALTPEDVATKLARIRKRSQEHGDARR